MKRNALYMLATVIAVYSASASLVQAGAGKPTNLIPDLKPALNEQVAGNEPAASFGISEGAAAHDRIAASSSLSAGSDNEGRDAMAAAVDAFASGNYSLAKVLLSAPGREDDPVANYCLGVMREYGLGMERNENEAFKHYRVAASGGHPQARYNIGLMFADGRGTGVDSESAFQWIKKAADQGLPVAQHTLGLMYFNGIGTEQEHVQALMWFELASASGNASSEQNRDSLAQLLKSDQRLKARQMASLWQPAAN